MSIESGLSIPQINQWFTNSRRRLVPFFANQQTHGNCNRSNEAVSTLPQTVTGNQIHHNPYNNNGSYEGQPPENKNSSNETQVQESTNQDINNDQPIDGEIEQQLWNEMLDLDENLWKKIASAIANDPANS